MQENEVLSDSELRAHARGREDERKRIAVMMMKYDVRDHVDDCTCEPCQLFAEVFRSGVPESWIQGHNLDING